MFSRQLFTMQLSSEDGRIQLHQPPQAVLLVVVSSVGGLGLLLFAAQTVAPVLRSLWLPILGLWIATTALNVLALFWWTTIEFDRSRDRFRRGPRTVGRVSAIVAIERRDGLIVAFRNGSGPPRRWRIPGIDGQAAADLGPRLAAELGLPLK